MAKAGRSLETGLSRVDLCNVGFECPHYYRKCALLTPCCNEIYKCRLCHDEKEDHTLNSKGVTKILCLLCDSVQQVQRYCGFCGERFAKYTCLECRLYDDIDKKQFHCHDCGICRVGGRENFFHCKKCNLCLSIGLRNNHLCVENASRQNCPICVEDMHASVEVLTVPKCGHLLHKKCLDELKQSGRSTCTVCQKNIS